MFAFPKDEETDALLRQSTRQADDGNWDAAIATLRIVWKRMMVSPVAYPVETWCKLPLYLSRAGRFDEADEAFDWLESDLERRAARDCEKVSPERKKAAIRSNIKSSRQVIKAKREVAARRRKKAE